MLHKIITIPFIPIMQYHQKDCYNAAINTTRLIQYNTYSSTNENALPIPFPFLPLHICLYRLVPYPLFQPLPPHPIFFLVTLGYFHYCAPLLLFVQSSQRWTADRSTSFHPDHATRKKVYYHHRSSQ